MLKSTVENKQHSATFEAIDGRQYSRNALEDPARPGHLRPDLVPITPGVWSAGAHFGLLTNTGRPMKYVETAHDPKEPRPAEAPATLRKQVDEAEAAAADVRTRLQAALDKLGEAQDAERQALARNDERGFNLAKAREQEAEPQWQALEAEWRAASSRLSNAQQSVRAWVDDERLRRSGRA